MEGLPRLTVARAKGGELFTANGQPLGLNLLSFSQWAWPLASVRQAV